MDGDGAGVAGEGVAPDVFEQLFGGVDAFAVAHEEFKEVEFPGLEADGPVAQGDLAGGAGEGEFAGLDGVAGWGVGVADFFLEQFAAAEHGFDAGDEFAHGEGLGHVVVGADFEADDTVDFVVTGGEHEDGDSAGAADLAADVEAVHAGEHEVEHQEVGLVGEGEFEAAFAVGGSLDLVALAAEVVGDGAGEAFLVLDDQDPGHNVSPRAPDARAGCLRLSTIRRSEAGWRGSARSVQRTLIQAWDA